MTDVAYLRCPECGEEKALPSSDYLSLGPCLPAQHTWTEDDRADCPGCGVFLCAEFENDDCDDEAGGWMEARVLCRLCLSTAHGDDWHTGDVTIDVQSEQDRR